MLSRDRSAHTVRDDSIFSRLRLPRYFFEVDGRRSGTTWDEKTYSNLVVTQESYPVVMGEKDGMIYWLYKSEIYRDDIGYTANQVRLLVDRRQMRCAIGPSADGYVEMGNENDPTGASLARSLWRLPPIELLHSARLEIDESELRKIVRIIEETLSQFDVPGRVVEVNQGPRIAQYCVEPKSEKGEDKYRNTHSRNVSVSSFLSLQHDIELAIGRAPLRIEAPIPGRNTIGIEVPNTRSSIVGVRDVMESPRFKQLGAKSKLALALGLDDRGVAQVAELSAMPHLLIAGTTGSGKSVCINAIIIGLICTNTPDQLRLVLIDPQRVELIGYNGIPHLLAPVAIAPPSAAHILRGIAAEMDRRLRLFPQMHAHDLEDYNKIIKGYPDEEELPAIVVVVDEPAELLDSPDGVEEALIRIAQRGGLAGVHLIIATHRPTLNVVNALIRANFPSRIAFRVMSHLESLIVLDTAGAEELHGPGDMLFRASDTSVLVRLQGCFVSDNEIERVVRHWKSPDSLPAASSIGPPETLY